MFGVGRFELVESPKSHKYETIEPGDDMEELLVISIIAPTHGLGTEKSALGDSKISTDWITVSEQAFMSIDISETS